MKGIVIAVLIVLYLYGLLLSIVQMRSASNPIPKNVSDVYDQETYARWRTYHHEKIRLSIFSQTVSALTDLLLIAFNVYAVFARLFPQAPFWQLFSVVLLSELCAQLLIPFSYHNTMVIEEKYGFNRSTKKTFWTDVIKDFLVEVIFTTIIGTLLMALHQWLGDWLILAFAIAMTVLVMLISFLYPIFSRLFNRFTPLEDGELKEKLTALLEKHGYRVRAIQVMDASRRTTKSNAYFTGFGNMKTIVLYDNLVKSMTCDEICAVFAHEMGHGLHKDTLKNQILSYLQMLLLAVLAFFTLRTPECFTAFGFEGINYGFALLLIMSVEFAVISPFFGILANARSRRAEYRADRQAVEEGYGEALISALKKLARENFAELAPSPLLVFLEDSHPTLSQRIDAIEKLSK